MLKRHRPYPPEFWRRIVELAHKEWTPEELGRQFEPSPQCIRNWVRHADRDEGHRQDGLTTAEQDQLRRLRRENHALREERARGRRSPAVLLSSTRGRRPDSIRWAGSLVVGRVGLSPASGGVGRSPGSFSQVAERMSDSPAISITISTLQEGRRSGGPSRRPRPLPRQPAQAVGFVAGAGDSPRRVQ